MSFLKKENFLKVLQSMNLYKKIFCNTKDANKSSYTIKEHDHNTRVIESHTYKFLRKFDIESVILSIIVRRNDFYEKKKTCFIIIKWLWENDIISLWKIKVSQTDKSNISGFTWSFRALPHFNMGFPSGSAVNNCLQCRRQGFNAWVGTIL